MSVRSSKFLFVTLRTLHCKVCGHQTLGLFRPYSSDVPGTTQKSQPLPRRDKRFNFPVVTQRSLSAVARMLKGHCRPLSRFEYLDITDAEEAAEKALACQSFRRFIVNPDLARTVVSHLDPDLVDSNAVIFECNPGPGVVTRTLLNAGAHRVVVLESERAFLPELQSLENSLDGRLEVVHCDFFKLDPIGHGSMKPPAMYAEKLFHDLGISEASWSDDVPVKVFGIFSQRNERSMLWKLIYALYERISIYRYGRIELIMFISEKEYLKLVSPPGHLRNYQALGVLWQMACEIQLLHKEPWSSFITTAKSGGLGIPKSILPNDHLCLVKITPRRDLFSGALTTENSTTLLLMIKQCLAKRKAKLVDRLNSWSPGSGSKLLKQLELPEDIITGHVYPEEYKRLFEAMEHSAEFSQSWLYDEVLENTRNMGF